MSLNKIIIIFIVILIIFSGFIFFQFNKVSVPKSKVTIKNQTFFVQVASSSAEQEKGLSGRKSLPQDQGMLFVFKEQGDYTFWMKDMQFPLDIIFIKDSKIVSISKNAQPQKVEEGALPLYNGSQPSDKVLEINAGLSDKYKLTTGDTVTLEIK